MQPILVTGVPRSGTTWLARLLAHSPGTALAGREPMNPRGRQYALGGTLDGWVRMQRPSPRQHFLLDTAYRGWNPMVYSRFGTRQWAAWWPGTRLIVKDPYAMLSMPAVAAATGAVPVLVYRHPGAVLVSYRRVGWQPKLDEVASIARSAGLHDLDLSALQKAVPGRPVTAEELGVFWAVLHELALADAASCGALVVSHAELASGGDLAGRTLANRLGLAWSPAMSSELTKEASTVTSASVVTTRLHNFDRSPAAVADEWRTKLLDADTEAIERVTADTMAKVDSARLRLI